MTQFNIDIVADTVCPWCYVGKKRIERAISTHKSRYPTDTFSITWRPFYLDPSSPKEGEDKQARYERRFGGKERVGLMHARMGQLGLSEGINFKFGGRTGNSRDSHRLVQLGKTKGPEMQTRVIEELYASYFENEGDVTAKSMLAEAGVKAGLDKAEVDDWLNGPGDKGGKEVDNEVYQAQTQSISGVPHFTVQGNYELSGAQEPEAFLEVFEAVKKREG